ncbi:MAG: hypothetical protein JWO49_995 [Arthrobacter sp.]|nr:hypothetical protein [Arthrobacter sp.]
MSETPEAFERRHSEAPVEGDPAAEASDVRAHAQEPAEGADFEEKAPDVPPLRGAVGDEDAG